MARSTRSKLSLGVVIPCHNNSWQLRGVLPSLYHQTVRPDAVIVVDDNSSWQERRRLRHACRAFGIRFARLAAPTNHMEELGRRSAARNLGTKRLGTDVVLYLDGDMLLGPRYVEAIRYYHARFQGVYIRGRRHGISVSEQRRGMGICLDEVRANARPKEAEPLKYILSPATLRIERIHTNAQIDRWDWCASNNLSVRAEHVSRIGYWDEGFLGWGEEDMDFSFRLHQAGLMPILLLGEEAHSYHLDHPVDHETNANTLQANAERFLGKFPQVADVRKQAYARFGIDTNDLWIRKRASLAR